MTFKTNIAQYETATGDKLLYPFGPPIFQCEVDEKFTKDLIEEGRKLDIKNNDFSSNLAGNLKYGRSYHYKKEFTLKAENYLQNYVKRFEKGLTSQFQMYRDKDFTGWAKLIERQDSLSEHYNPGDLRGKNKKRAGIVRLDSLWVNFSKKHDYNPPHTHSGILSFVIFCKIPNKIFSVQADSNAQKAGYIVFQYGVETKLSGVEYPIKPYENLMFIFPADLSHYVPGFWVDEERITVSGNFVAL